MKCPSCGGDAVCATVSGPDEATIAPCGCSIAPSQLPESGGGAA